MSFDSTEKVEAYRFFAIAFNAAPGATNYRDIGLAYEGGAPTKQIVNEFTKKGAFKAVYSDSLTDAEFATALVTNVVGEAATADARQEAVRDIQTALSVGVTRGDVIYQIFTNLSALRSDAKWGGVARKLDKQVEVARYFTEDLKADGASLTELRAVIAGVDGNTDTSPAALNVRLAAYLPKAAPKGEPIATPALKAKAASETPVNTAFNDPLFGSQWNLLNVGQRYLDTAASTRQEKIDAAKARNGGLLLDINVMDAWKAGFTGRGVVQSVSDDGFDLQHEDVQGNLLRSLSFNAASKQVGEPTFGASGDTYSDGGKEAHQHGTVVGTIAANEANNGKGVVGVAFESKLLAALVLGTKETADTAEHIRYLREQRVEVSLNSYGQDPAFSEDYRIPAGTPPSEYTANQRVGVELALGASQGREGKGMVFEFSAGNERTTKADSAMTNGTSSRYVIAVGSMNELGDRASYGSRGTNILVSAFGGDGEGSQDKNEGFGIVAGDVRNDHPLNKGYNASETAPNYSFFNTGTSYSGPTVGAVAALMLQANPDLGFRDVSTILAMTARRVGSQAENQYVTNAAADWNLGGMHHSSEGVGYGLVDATAAVRLAEQWFLARDEATRGTVATWKSIEAVAASAAAGGTPIPDKGTSNGVDGLVVTATVATSSQQPDVRIERMEFEIKLSASAPSELRAVVVSPAGTEAVIFNEPLSREKAKANDAAAKDTPWPGIFTIGSASFLGENAAGTWTLKLYDMRTGEMVDAKYESWTVRAWGSAVSSNSQYTFTREYTATGRTLIDSAGVDTLNAAAVHGAVTLNLVAGQINSIGNDTASPGTFTIAAGSLIENAIGGGGADSLIGNALDNLLKGSWGNDTLSAGDGQDTLCGGQGADQLTGGNGADRFVITEDVAAATTPFLKDVVTDFVSGVDKLVFSSTALARLPGWIGNTAGLNGRAGSQGANSLVVGTAANGDHAQLVFNPASGALFLDPDGTGALVPIELVTLTGIRTLVVDDIEFTT